MAQLFQKHWKLHLLLFAEGLTLKVFTRLMLCLQSSHLGHDGARLYHLDPRWIQEGSKHNWNQCWPLSLASNIQVSECLRLGLRPPKASSKLRAPSTPAKPQHCRAVPAAGRQHFSSQQGSSDVPGMQVAAERHEKPPGNVLIGFIACYLVHGVRYALSIFVVLR